MINLRFHVVSLVAVFLALAAGIAIGATVVDRGLVAVQERNLDTLRSRLDDRDGTIERLERELADARRVGEQGERRFVAERLYDRRVSLVTTPDADTEAVERLVDDLLAAGADVSGPVVLRQRVVLDTDEDRRAARRALGAASERPATVAFLLRQRIAEALRAPDRGTTLAALRSGGFLEYETGTMGGAAAGPRATADSTAADGAVPAGSAGATEPGGSAESPSLVVVSIGGPDDAFAPFLDPLVRTLAGTSAAAVDVAGPVVVVSAPGAGTAGEKSGTDPGATLVGRVRTDDRLATAVSSVESIATVAGRVATVYALEDLVRGAVGHYGPSAAADRLIPAPVS